MLGLGLSFARQTAKVFSYVKDSLKAYFRFYDTTPDFLLDGSTSFDGSNDYIDTGSTFQSTFRDSFTISAWVKPNDGQPSSYSNIYGIYGDGADRIHLQLDTNGAINFRYKSDGDERSSTTSSAIFSDGSAEWKNIVAVADSSIGGAGGIKLYINGAEVSIDSGNTSGITFSDFTTTTNFILGARNHGTNGAENFYNGLLSNVGIWSRALSASEIESIQWRGSHSELKDTELTNLVSWYDLQGDVLDKQGSNDGTNNGATLNSDSYSGESPFKPRIQDIATPKMAVQLADGSTSFDGSDDHIQISDDSTIQNIFASGGTLSTWVYANSDGENSVGRIADKANWFLCLTGESAGLSDVRFLSVTSGDDGDWITTNTCVPNGEWTHIALVYNGSSTSNNPTIYVNGSSQALTESTTPASTQTSDASNDLYIGNRSDGIACFDGKMANFSIHSSALTQQQVQKLMFTEKYSGLSSDLKTNLVSWYDMGARVQTGSDVVYDETNATLGDELIVNGDFSSALGSEWDLTLGGGGGSISLVSNQLKMLQGGSSSTLYASQDFTTEVGATYQFTVDLVSSSGDAWIKLLAGTSQNGAQVRTSGYNYVTIGATNALSFVATATTTWITIQESQGAGSSSVWDNVSVKKVSGNAGIVYASETNNGATTTTGYISSPHGVVDPLNFGEVYSGRALSFDGSNDYVESGASNAIVTGTNISYSIWVKSTDSDSAYLLQLQKGAGSTSLTLQLNATGAGIFGLVIWDGSTHNNVLYSAGLNDSKWHHIVTTTTSNAQVLYLDGVAVATGSETFVNASSSDLFQIGRIGSGSSFFGGSVSSLKGFNSVLTQAQVQELYTKPETVLPTGVSASNLKLDLPMQEGAGSYIYDGSGNQNHGTINGATWATGESDGYQSSLVRSNTPMIFDGTDDWVEISHPMISGTSDFTFSIWINKQNDISSARHVAGNYTGSNLQGIQFGINGDEKFYTYTDGTNDYVTCTTALSSNVWNHLVVTRSSNSVVIYLNGSSDATGSLDNDIGNSDNFFIGANPLEDFTGLVNEIAIWDVALDSDAVTALYGSGTPLNVLSDSGNYDNSDDLQGYWRNDGITTWTDRTPLGVYGSELLTNGDFSSFSSGQATSWTTTNSPTLSEETTIVQSGSSQKIFMGSSGNNGIDQTVTTVAGKKYQFSAKVYVTGGRARIIFDNGSDDGQTYVGTGGSTGYEALNTWHTITHIKTAESTSVTARIWTSSANTTVYVDDVSIKRYRGGNDGTASGSPVSIVIPEGSTEGRDNQGFLLSDTTSISNGIRLHGGGEYVSIQDSEVLSFGDGTDDKPLTFEAWVKMDDATDFIIFSKGIYNTNYEYFFGTFSSDKFGLELYDEDVDSTYERAYTSSALTSYEGQWVHLCATYDGRGGTSANAGIALYVNGVSQSVTLDDAGTYASMVNGGADLHIGRYNTSYKKGLVDEVRVYHKVLSASEVLKNYNNGKSAHQ